MKKLLIISFIAGTVALMACGDGVKRTPGRVYMPDMMYSRAYETYSVTEEQKKEWEKQGIYFTETPVAGTVKRGADFTFRLPKDKPGDSTNYVAARQIKNPITQLDSGIAKEVERVYLVNCGICHGAGLNGDGPLYKGGDGPYPAKPANLVSDPKIVGLSDGQLYYSITYGKNMMGSYASQVSSTQRWQIIAYIRSKQHLANAATNASGTSGTAAGAQKDSTAKGK